MKIFGDDGFRDIFGEKLLSVTFLNNFFRTLNFILYQKKIKKIFIGFDTRASSKKILKIIFDNIKNIEKIYIIKNPISTPAIQFISKENKSFGIMITASHFSESYNGFKFFLNGEKISKKFEKKITQRINKKNFIKKNNTAKKLKIGIHPYIKMINARFKTLNLNKKKVMIDCANGSISSFYDKIYFLRKINIKNTNYKKFKINNNCGSNFLKKNLKKKSFKSFDYCLALDGDGDRLLIANRKYGLIESEKLALIYYLYLNSKQDIVGTEITNPWLKEKIKLMGKNLHLTKVGDRNVIEKKKQIKAIFGFETSGHFCFNETMDGLYSAGLFLEILNKKEFLINDVLKMKISFKSLIYRIKKKNSFLIRSKLKNSNNHKIIIRSSIWEDVLKVYLFYKKIIPQLSKIQKFLIRISLK